jgi:hypothetical protein
MRKSSRIQVKKIAIVLDKSVSAMASMDISDRGRLNAGMSLLQR